jgi:hypothetical protein
LFLLFATDKNVTMRRKQEKTVTVAHHTFRGRGQHRMRTITYRSHSKDFRESTGLRPSCCHYGNSRETIDPLYTFGGIPTFHKFPSKTPLPIKISFHFPHSTFLAHAAHIFALSFVHIPAIIPTHTFF